MKKKWDFIYYFSRIIRQRKVWLFVDQFIKKIVGVRMIFIFEKIIYSGKGDLTCLNGGKCENDHCQCSEHFMGHDCSIGKRIFRYF
jgi:hypothetical protein